MIATRYTALCTCWLVLQDYFFHDSGIKNGGNRYATVIAYLSDVESGGETVSKEHTCISAQQRSPISSNCIGSGPACPALEARDEALRRGVLSQCANKASSKAGVA